MHHPLPVPSLTHSLTHSLHLSPQRFDEFSFHIVNVIAHCLATVLTLPLFRALLASSGFPYHVALSASAMFASHPIHTDAVSSIVSRGEPLSAIMYILSLLTYMAVSSPSRSPRGFLLEVVRHAILLPLSAGLAFVGMLCKEMAITVVGIQVRALMLPYTHTHSRLNGTKHKTIENTKHQTLNTEN